MKKNNKPFYFLLTILVFLFISCNNLLSKQTQNKSATLFFSINGYSSRNILPDTSVSDFTDFVLTGKINGTATIFNLGKWDTARDMLEDSISIVPGAWELTLSAKKGQIIFTAETQVIIADGKSATAAFSLLANDENMGTLDIILRYPENTFIDGVDWEIIEVDDSNPFSSIIADYYYSGVCYEGSCYRRFTQGDAIQTITDTEFTLKTSLPAGRYIFECTFFTGESTGAKEGEYASHLDSYSDYIVIQSGLESKLDYTIDYFELTGVINAVSTPQGMELTLGVPKGTKDIIILKLREEDDNFSYMIRKSLQAPVSTFTTMTVLDPYEFKAGDSLLYGVYFINMDSLKMNMSSALKCFPTNYDGHDFPVFTTYPEFETDLDDNGLSTNIKFSNTPVLDLKDSDNVDGYKLYCDMSSNFYPVMFDFEFDENTREFDITDDLYPGKNPMNHYMLAINMNGWTYVNEIDTSPLTENQIPAVQGPAPAVATEEGIYIKIHYENNKTYESACLSLLRATAADGTYLPIVENWRNSGEDHDDYYEYLDKTSLEQGKTYYYKVVDSKGKTYCGNYFAATSGITTSSSGQINTAPAFSLSDSTIVNSCSTGDFEITSDIKRIESVFEYTEENNSNCKLAVRLIKYKKDGDEDWQEKLNSYFKGETGYSGSYESSVGYSHETQNNLYHSELDGKKFIFSSAYVKFLGDGGKQNEELLDVISFTPQEGSYPQVIQMPIYKPQLTVTPTAEGNIVTISNLSENVTSIHCDCGTELSDSRDGYYMNRRYYFEDINISSGTFVFTDAYVTSGNEYHYTVYSSGVLHFSIPESDQVVVTAVGGSGEVGLSSLPTAVFNNDDKTMTFTNPPELSNGVIPEYMSLRFVYEKNAKGNNKTTNAVDYDSKNLNKKTNFDWPWEYQGAGTYNLKFDKVDIYYATPTYRYQGYISISNEDQKMPQQIIIPD